jgi:peptidoglycan/xylan/chitin deacetylase (PgdA/CDA1 family)
MTALSAAQQAQQMDAAPSSIVAAAGVQPCSLRAPGGSFNPTTLALARERGMTLTGWSNDTIDCNAPLSITPAYQAGIVDRAINPVYDNPIVLLHDGSPGNYRQNTVDSLQRIIDSYRSRGYVFTDPLGRTGHTGDPAGSLDFAVSPAPAQISVAGWSFDPPASTEPVGIHSYINGVGYPAKREARDQA